MSDEHECIDLLDTDSDGEDINVATVAAEQATTNANPPTTNNLKRRRQVRSSPRGSTISTSFVSLSDSDEREFELEKSDESDSDMGLFQRLRKRSHFDNKILLNDDESSAEEVKKTHNSADIVASTVAKASATNNDRDRGVYQRLRKKVPKVDNEILFKDDDSDIEEAKNAHNFADIVATVSMSSTAAKASTTDSDHDNDIFSATDDASGIDNGTKHDEMRRRKLKKGSNAITAHNKGNKACTKDIEAESCSYLKSLRMSVKKRKFPLSQIPKAETISTGRTIKKMTAWKGHWPPLREFLQNTIDHLCLLDGRTGRRRACIDLYATTTATKSKLTFSCGRQKICMIHVSQDELIIDQLYTYPIASRALDTGVPDTTKVSGNQKSNDDQAGGFGDGFKTAAVALIANSEKTKGATDFKALKWYFYARNEQTEVEWTFEALTKESVATFARCDVLQVNIQKRMDINVNRWKFDDDNDDDGASARDEEGQQYIMRQVIQVKGIGKSFTQLAIPRFVVFWDLHEHSLLSTIPMLHTSRTTRGGGDFIGPVSAQPPLFSPPLLGTTASLKPYSGVYVRGIYVRPSKIKDTIMSFFGNRLEVIGRDRNEVNEEQLIDAVVYVFQRCSNMAYLKKLLEPLRTQGSGTKNSNAASWLLSSPRFFNQVIELQKNFILYSVFQIPKGAIFVSSKTTSSKDPFIQWAASFLQKNGTPLVPIEKGSNRYLFEEVNESDLTERCVRILLKGGKNNSSRRGGVASDRTTDVARKFFRKIFTCMGIGRQANVYFFPDVKVAFIHDTSIYIPEVKQLTRDIIVRVLNICNSRIEGVNTDSYSCILQAIFEIIPPSTNNTLNTASIDIAEADKVVARAKKIQKEIRDFLRNPICGDCDIDAAEDPPRKKRSHTTSSSRTETQDLTMINDNDSDNSNKNTGAQSEQTLCNNQQLERQIERISRIARGESNVTNIIPQVDFDDDNAGNTDSCLRPSSSLEKITVNASFGGGCLHCDHTSAVAITNRKWDGEKQRRLLILRAILQEASNIVLKSIPSLHTLLGRIHAGYDGDNNTYEAFCDGQHIIVNLFAYMHRLNGDTVSMDPPYPRNLVHDLVIMITHELAHFLEPRGGHGPEWRDTHMKMVIEVMSRLEK